MARRKSAPDASFVFAEEDGLVTARLAPAARTAAEKRARSVGVRLRLKPPAKLLREDDHLFDESVLPALMKALPRPPDAPWTDTVVGVGRVTVSFAARSAAAARGVQAVLQAVDLGAWKGWVVEEVRVEKANRERLKRLHELAGFDGWNRSKAHVAALSRVISRSASPGALAALAGLDGPRPTAARVTRALRWLDAQLAVIEPAVLAALKAKDGRELGLWINMHPRFRQVDFSLFDGDGANGEPLSVEQAAVLERHFAATHPQLRRMAGVLWAGNVEAIAGATRIHLGAES